MFEENLVESGKSSPKKMYMNEKDFTYTLTDVPEDFKKIPGGSYIDNEFSITLDLKQETENDEHNIKFSIVIDKYPNMIPFWATLYIKIQDQETKYFINSEKKVKRIQKSFDTPFTNDIITNGTTITYKIKQIPSYKCPLKNDGCVCYLNCGLQLLFHLSKLRDLLMNTFFEEDKNPGWLICLKDLFDKMCTSKTALTTISLTESFGWPSSARRIMHDASEFIEIFLNHIRNSNKFDKNWEKKIDTIFAYYFISPESPKPIPRYILEFSDPKEKTFMEKFDEIMGNTKFVHFPEVLFIHPVDGMSPISLQNKLDLSKYGNESNLKHTKYTLSGIIYIIFKKNGVHHFINFVRASTEEVWIYFSDEIGIEYSWEYKRRLNKVITPLDNQIPNKFKNGQIHLLMYIADDVIDDYFTYSHAVPPYTNTSNNYYDGKTRQILVSTNDDIEKHVQNGHTDFEGVRSSLSFELKEEEPFTAVYEEVSKRLKVPIDSFVLRTEGKCCSPSFHEFQRKGGSLKNFCRYTIHLYYEEKKQIRPLFSQFVPFYFLLFKFNAQLYSHNINNNLIRPEAVQSNPPMQRNKGRIYRAASYFPKQQVENDQNSAKIQNKNSFQYLTSMVLNTSTTFESITKELLEIINERDGQKKHTKVTLFTAEYSDPECKNKIGYKPIDLTKKIKEYNILDGIYIYVQCDDDFVNDDDDSFLIQSITKPKFLFFKYMNQVYKNQIYPKKIPYVFMMEKFSVPVTFCKLSDPKNKQKTMLFPIKAPIRNIEQLKKIICAAMGEKYPDNGLMQLFFGFNTEIWPPFHDQIDDEDGMKKITRTLSQYLENSSINQKNLNFSPKSSSNQLLLEKLQNGDEIETDNEYSSKIFIHYHIFEEFTTKQDISVRVYFSKDAITISSISQIKISNEAKVIDVINKMREVFGDELDEEDKANLLKFEQKDPNFNFLDFYRIIKIWDGRISDSNLKLHSTLSSSIEIRVERIQRNINIDDLECYIPVFYGARYNPQKEEEYNTEYIASVGTPFYLPVLKSDHIDPNINGRFELSSLYMRLKSMITEKEIKFTLFVVNYTGMIQDVEINDLDTIIRRNLNYSICINDLNASTFIDEYKFFMSDLQIII